MLLPSVLEVLTLNVWGLPWPFARDHARRFRRIARHFSANDYDIVGIQEAWWPFGARVRIPGLRLGAGRRDSGLGLAGRLLDGAKTELFGFDRASGADRFARKGWLCARLDGLLVAVTHLQAGVAPDVRRHQVGQLVDWLEGERGPVLLMGDFNFDGTDRDSEAVLVRAGLRDVAEEAPAPTWMARNPFVRDGGTERYDRIYVRDGGDRRWSATRVRVLPSLWSDHQPVHATLTVG